LVNVEHFILLPYAAEITNIAFAQLQRHKRAVEYRVIMRMDGKPVLPIGADKAESRVIVRVSKDNHSTVAKFAGAFKAVPNDF
jgi:hypothetical protein